MVWSHLQQTLCVDNRVTAVVDIWCAACSMAGSRLLPAAPLGNCGSIGSVPAVSGPSVPDIP